MQLMGRNLQKFGIKIQGLTIRVHQMVNQDMSPPNFLWFFAQALRIELIDPSLTT